MEVFHEYVKKAQQSFKAGDHLLYVTYPLVKDMKLIVTIVENFYIAVVMIIDAALYYDKMFKRITIVPESFESRFEIFKNKSAERYGFTKKEVEVIRDLRTIVKSRRESPMEFVRKEKFVICSDGYSAIRAIDVNLLKAFSTNIRSMVAKLEKIG